MNDFLNRLPDPIGNLIRRLQNVNPVTIYLGLGSAAVLLLVVGVLGAILTRPDRVVSETPGLREVSLGDEGVTTTTVDETTPTAEESAAAASAQARTTQGTTPRKGIAAQDLVSTVGATRVGITPTEIRWGLHAPETFNGQPLNLAEDPLEGVDIYLKAINQTGVHGRKIEKHFADDRYTVEGAKSASDTLLNDKKVFYVSGTLGIDQVATIASAAKDTEPFPTPYMAAGGSEVDHKSIGMYQIAGSYDTHLIKLAEFLSSEVKKAPCPPPFTSCAPNQSIYGGLKRVAAVELDSKYIRGSVASLEAAVKATGNLEWAGAVKVLKYTDSSNTHVYAGQCLELGNMGAQIVVPAVDPLTTSNMTVTGECARFKWTMSNFAHDSDVALSLMGGTWVGVRGLSGGCYYEDWNKPVTAQGKCGKLKEAHDQWAHSNGESDWTKDGQGGIAGYQITHFWLGALKSIGPDPTREKMVAALNAYNGYDDLVSSPISFLDQSNLMHGIEKFAVYEAGTNSKWRMISDGLVGSF